MDLQSTSPNIKTRYVIIETWTDKVLFKVLNSNFTAAIVLAYSVGLLFLGAKLFR